METYQIDVARLGKHLFRTDKFNSKEIAQEVARELAILYGEENITLIRWAPEYGYYEDF